MNSATRCSSGSYRYLCNGEDSGIEETWQVSEAAGCRKIECERRARPVGITIGVESSQSGNRFEYCNIRWRQETNSKPVVFSADYDFKGESPQVSRQGGGESRRQAVSTPCIFSPLMRIYNGGVIRQLLAAGGTSRVLVPWIQDHRQQDRLLFPDYSRREAVQVSEDSLCIDGRQVSCTKFHYSGGEYPADTPLWLDTHNVMLMYQWRQDRNTLWEVKLQDYQPLS